MDPVGVVVILKLSQFFFQIAPVPEKNLVQMFASDGADEPFGKRMRYRDIGNGFLSAELPESSDSPATGGSDTGDRGPS